MTEELRWILLVAGVVLIAGVYLWGLRSRRRSAAPEHERATRHESPPATRSAAPAAPRLEPGLEPAEGSSERGSFASASAQESLPVIEVDREDAVLVRATQPARREPRIGDTAAVPTPDAAPPPRSRASAAGVAPATATRPPAAPQKIFALRVTAPASTPFGGRALREAITEVPFTVKTRIGVDDPALFETLLTIYGRHGLDLLTVHGRTVREMYWSKVHYDFIARAVEVMDCPVLANGNVDSPESALAVLKETGAHGLMLGRGAIRNPWVFEQIRAAVKGEPIRYPTGREVLRYVERLFEVATDEGFVEEERVHRVKKHLNFIGVGVPPSAAFLHRMRRARAREELFEICAAFLDHDRSMTLVGEG
jgi:hypothetical protein